MYLSQVRLDRSVGPDSETAVSVVLRTNHPVEPRFGGIEPERDLVLICHMHIIIDEFLLF